MDQLGRWVGNLTDECHDCVGYVYGEGRGGKTSERWPTAVFPAFIAGALQTCSPAVVLSPGCAMDAAGNGNGVVDTSDLLVLLASFGLRC